MIDGGVTDIISVNVYIDHFQHPKTWHVDRCTIDTAHWYKDVWCLAEPYGYNKL